jgi:hypothetical protein
MVPLVVSAGGSRSTASGMGAPVVGRGVAPVEGKGGCRVRMGVGVLAHCWVLGQQDRPPAAESLPCPVVVPGLWSGSGRAEASSREGWCGGAVRVVVWELHSGREHLIFIAAMITPPGVVWWRRECSHL